MRARRRAGTLMGLSLTGLLVACSLSVSPSATSAPETTPTSIPTATADATPTPSLVVTPPPAPTAERTPTATPTEAAPEPWPPVRITEFTRGLHPGDTASVTARTPSGVPCTLYRTYSASEGGYNPAGPKPIKVGTQVAGAEGVVGWRWLVDPPVGSRLAWVNVECEDGAGIAFATIWIWPSDLTSSATIPPELLGTWVLEWAIQGPGTVGCSPPEPCPSVTFVIGPCSLGERCGSLIEADKPGCRFPLVFGTVGASNGDFVLDAGEDDRAGCREGWGQGLHFVPTADGTARLWAADGFNVILHRVESAPTPTAAP